MATKSIEQRARLQLYSLAEDLESIPIQGVTPPEASDYAAFLREHPQFAHSYFKPAAFALAESREASEGLAPNMQRLVGTLIRVSFSDEVLVVMATEGQSS